MSDQPSHWENATKAHNAFGFLARMLPEAPGAVPFHTVAAGVCVHPQGVILTCLHNVERFIEHVTPYTAAEAAEFSRRGERLPYEELEALYFAFLQNISRRPLQVTSSGVYRYHMPIFQVHWAEGGGIPDLAALLIAPVEGYIPLPHVNLLAHLPSEGQKVFLLGHFRPDNTPKDAADYPSGYAVLYRGAQVIYVGGDFFLIDFAAREGMSGGPVVDPETGGLLGIICERWPAELTRQRVGITAEATLVVGHPYSGRFVASALAQVA